MSSYPASATYPSTAHYPGAGVVYPSTAQYPGGTPTFVGPLDAFTTGMVQAGWVFRLLSSWTGNLFRVRRQSDNSELDIGYLPTGLPDMASLSSFVGVGAWNWVKLYDQSGSGVDLVQGTAALQPLGAIDGNGLPYMTSPTGTASADGPGIQATGLAIVANGGLTALCASASTTNGLISSYLHKFDNTDQGEILAAGTTALGVGGMYNFIALTTIPGSLYVMGGQSGTSANRARLTIGTASDVSAVFSVFDLDEIHIGGNFNSQYWCGDATIYGHITWNIDIGNSSLDDAVNIIRPLIGAL